MNVTPAGFAGTGAAGGLEGVGTVDAEARGGFAATGGVAVSRGAPASEDLGTLVDGPALGLGERMMNATGTVSAINAPTAMPRQDFTAE